mmetsp:Transcript_58502/g.163995  ORF Transcript_58502/g.163995 Transcript_58502/m.163995 type:complete len:231 (+) Transcript_58502:499-1191(+)
MTLRVCTRWTHLSSRCMADAKASAKASSRTLGQTRIARSIACAARMACSKCWWPVTFGCADSSSLVRRALNVFKCFSISASSKSVVPRAANSKTSAACPTVIEGKEGSRAVTFPVSVALKKALSWSVMNSRCWPEVSNSISASRPFDVMLICAAAAFVALANSSLRRYSRIGAVSVWGRPYSSARRRRRRASWKSGAPSTATEPLTPKPKPPPSVFAATSLICSDVFVFK